MTPRDPLAEPRRPERHPGYAPPDATGHHAHDGERSLHAGGDRPHSSHDSDHPAPELTDEQVEALLRLVFDADPMPEIAVVPPELLAELARRAAERDPAKATMSVAAARRHNKRARREAERHHTGP